MSITEVLTDLFLFFEDLKFWKKKKAHKKLEKEKGLPKKIMIDPSSRYTITAILMSFVLIIMYFLIVSPILNRKVERVTKERIVDLKEIINTGFLNVNQFPNKLSDVIKNNPLERDKITDYWGNEFYYEISKDKLGYILLSKGKDGKLNTKDDIK